MPNLRAKTWTTTTPAKVDDAQFWEDHLLGDEGAPKTVGALTIKTENDEMLGTFNGSENKEITIPDPPKMTVDSELSETSENPVQNKVITNEFKKQSVAIDNRIKKFYTSNMLSEHVEDSDDGVVRDLKLYGRSEQASTSGKNLAETKYKGNTYSGYSITLDSDGGYIINGTIPATLSVRVDQTFGGADNLKNYNGKYTLTVYDKNKNVIPYSSISSPTTIVCGIMQNSTWSISGISNNTATSINKDNCFIVVYIPAGTYNNEKFYVQLVEGEPLGYFESYTGGQPSPSPSYPQEIHSVVNPKMEISTECKYDTFVNAYINSIQGFITNSYWRTNDDVIPLFGAKTVIVDISLSDVVSNYFAFTDENGNYVDKTQIQNSGRTVVNVPSNAEIKAFYLSINRASFPSNWNDGIKIYIVRQSATLNGITLNAIPVTSGGNVTINGQQYISDYVDVERSKWYEVVSSIDLGILNWNYGNSRFSANLSGIKQILSWNTKMNALCNKYKVTSGVDLNDNCIAKNDGANNAIIIKDTAHTTVPTPSDNWLSGTYLYYERATPIEHDLTAEQLEQFLALRSYYGTTNATVTSDDLDGASEFLYPCSIENFVEHVKEQQGDTRKFIYDLADISEQAFINSQYAEVMLEFMN